MVEKKEQPKEQEKRKLSVKMRSERFSEPFKYKIISDGEINLSLDRAYQFLELATFNGERPVSETHVQFLFDEWTAGRFMWHHILLASAELDGKIYRINGQHTCWMRVSIPKTFEPVKCVCRDMVYKVENEQQLRTLYSTFDRGKHRSVGHVSRVLLTDTEAARDLPSHVITKLVAGFKVFWTEDHNKLAEKGLNVNEIVGIISKNYSSLFNVVGHWFRSHYDMGGLSGMWLRRAGVLGAMLATFQKSVEAASEFWGPCVEGVGLDTRDDPRFQLREFMMTHSNNNTLSSTKTVVSTEDTYRVCINAWNKWRRKEKSQFLRTTEKRFKPV